MMDEGGSGATPLLGTQASTFRGEDISLDIWELLSQEGTLDTAIRATGTKPVKVKYKGAKADLYQKLSASGGTGRGMSAADWVDESQEVYYLVMAAVAKFEGKASKAREDGPLKRVLAYLKDWIKG
jgi:hypothetical protein